MVERSVQWTAEAVGGRVAAGDAGARWRRVAIDTRKIEGGELFVALPGEHADGHDFVRQAVDRGAAAVLVHRDLGGGFETSGTAAIRVADTYEALHELTRAVRRDMPGRLVAITGSAGKTTTKELVAALLAGSFRVAKSPGNFNNLYGFPVSLLGIGDDSEWMVAEMGMSTPGELRSVSLLGRPDVAIFTNVRAVHLVNFASVGEIAEAKSELLAGLSPSGVLVANADDREVMRIARRHLEASPGVRLLTYGVANPDATVRAAGLAVLEDRIGSRFRLSAPAFGIDGEDLELGVHGLYNVENALAALACALHLGVPMNHLRQALAGFRPAAMRGEVHRLASGALLVDDSYNSNPDAAERALESARRLPGKRHVAILGDMLELGPQEAAYHRRVGEGAGKLGFEVLAVGPLSADLADAAAAAGSRTHHFADAQACLAWLGNPLHLGLHEGDVVLVKASRGTGLDLVVRGLLAADEGEV